MRPKKIRYVLWCISQTRIMILKSGYLTTGWLWVLLLQKTASVKSIETTSLYMFRALGLFERDVSNHCLFMILYNRVSYSLIQTSKRSRNSVLVPRFTSCVNAQCGFFFPILKKQRNVVHKCYRSITKVLTLKMNLWIFFSFLIFFLFLKLYV